MRKTLASQYVSQLGSALMGLYEKLIGRYKHPPPRPPTVTSRISREEMVQVVGESHYQPAIRAACGWTKPAEILFDCMAELVPEPKNPHDPNAIRVDIEGRQVGYLSRADAAEMGSAIAEGIRMQGTGMVRAVIAGHESGTTENLGVFLHMTISRDA
jgi:hypothetical protein